MINAEARSAVKEALWARFFEDDIEAETGEVDKNGERVTKRQKLNAARENQEKEKLDKEGENGENKEKQKLPDQAQRPEQYDGQMWQRWHPGRGTP